MELNRFFITIMDRFFAVLGFMNLEEYQKENHNQSHTSALLPNGQILALLARGQRKPKGTTSSTAPSGEAQVVLVLRGFPRWHEKAEWT